VTARHLQRLTGLEIEVWRVLPGSWRANATPPKTLHPQAAAEGRSQKDVLLRLRQANLNVLTHALMRKQGSRCALCGARGEAFEFDHVVSRARGGLDVIQNGRAVGSYCGCHRRRHGDVEWSARA